MCEPWRAVGVASSTPSAAGRSDAVRNVVRPSDARAGAASRPRSSRGRAPVSPASRRSAGSMKTQKQTIVESGLPGSPKTSVPAPVRPNQIGLPGLIFTRQKTSSTPQASNAGRTWSCGPTETPPLTTSTSAASPASTASIVAPRSSPTMP